jgi:hypothetical protein
MEAARTSETSLYFNETIWLCIPEGSRFYACGRGNLKSHEILDTASGNAEHNKKATLATERGSYLKNRSNRAS